MISTATRAAGITVVLVATLVTAFLEIQLSALRVGAVGSLLAGDSPYEGSGFALPLAVPLAVGANLALAWFALTTVGRWAVGLPWALWTLVMLAASGVRTDGGDYLVGGANWVFLVTMVAGSLTFAMFSYRLILKPPPVPAATDSGLSGTL
ncbi:hypothetical protein GCM10010112_06420 [Actinoplanes lobatus]|uniref:Uncharacterized protein n=1 Tax=Actinoplanes lobatus TaxID=113568 RepID=A0A7W7MEA5_9ACTN|nr:hypothetical protein [Actinoplanes lobatus]MBB4747062.1 hypothetical protein [Actinoplanes lobatus]GGN55505.1 hypothetical protein GCM10010112_06420 [Actinoplanes lobatus]GIE39370.1 hypothetical protein Alo02nite_22680 [Actinoplanes lobatus]